MLIDTGTLYIGTYSGTDGFVGFLWSLKIFNENGHYLDEWITSGCPASCSTGCPSEKLCPDSCEFGYYYDTSYAACKQCDSSQNCGGSYGCRSLLTCRLCKAKECSACSAFDDACSACITNAYIPSGNNECQCNLNAFWIQSTQTCEICDSLCDDCAETYYHECSQCSSSAIAVGTVCLHACPTGYAYSSPTCTISTSSIVDQSFYQDWAGLYGIFQTSSSAASYYFSTTVDTQDPVPVYNRDFIFQVENTWCLHQIYI
ncbi:unnamed protein product [Blepharisma stoltei]|uniref:TNFR-Cys domain-containing protein n=1 Tax=Blepharisma stoltei TaxID=1481888 RepID=A0AAU9KDW2_9CILI|nr:unnamed protein product [Blepharisma stoltei]